MSGDLVRIGKTKARAQRVNISGSDPDVVVRTAIGFDDTPAISSFARLRVENPETLFDSKQIFDDPDIANSAENFPLFYDNQETSGSGTSTTFNVNRASTTLAVSNATAGTRVRQTKQRPNYQPGKGQLVIFTAVIGNSSTGITKRIGYFDADDGLFFQHADGVASVVIRSNVTGSPVDSVIAQASWSLDKLDGSGASGVTLDFTKSQIFVIDFEWLGVGRIRFGVFIDGVLIYFHESLNTNRIASVYMSNPNLPVRCEISNDGNGPADSIEQICVTVISEGGEDERGSVRSGNLGGLAASEIQADVIGTTYAVCGIRLKSAYLGLNIKEISLSMIDTTGANVSFLWSIHLNPTLTTGLTYANVVQSGVQFGVGLPAGDVVTDDGIVIDSGYVSASLEGVEVNLRNALRLGALIDGTRDQLIVCVTPLAVNEDILGSLTWQELW